MSWIDHTLVQFGAIVKKHHENHAQKNGYFVENMGAIDENRGLYGRYNTLCTLCA